MTDTMPQASPSDFYVNTSKVSYYNVYKKLYAGKSYSRTFAKSEELLFEKDVVNFPGEEIATRLSGSLLLKCEHFKSPCPLTLRDAFSDNTPCSFFIDKDRARVVSEAFFSSDTHSLSELKRLCPPNPWNKITIPWG
jgi:hypothetical protein